MYSVKKDKGVLRRQYLQKRRDIPPAEKAELDRLICEKVTGSASYKYYDTILTYCAKPDEPDLYALTEKALSDGKAVAYPRCIPGSRRMAFHFVTDRSQLKPGVFGIMEPDASLPVYDPNVVSCSICLIPAILADKNGYRVGYGGGYYDRFLSVYSGTAATVVYSGFLVDSVPNGRYDLQSDMIITEGGISVVGKN